MPNRQPNPMFTVAARLLRDASLEGTPEAFARAAERGRGALLLGEILEIGQPHELAPFRSLMEKLDRAANKPELRKLLSINFSDPQTLEEILNGYQD